MPHSHRRPFTAEIQLSKHRQRSDCGVTLDDVYQLLLEMRKDAPQAETGAMAPALPAIPPEQEKPAVDEGRGEISLLKTELRALSFCIAQTKSEIAALRPPSEDLDHLATVTSELDAIVMSTESATQQILEAAERLENCARDMRAHVGDAYANRILEDMLEVTTSIFEACNFQDITGQRISKAVRTLKFIDERICSMVTIWGGEDGLADAALDPVQDNRKGDDLLLNGPQLGDSSISQDEIDKLFAIG